MKRIIKNQESAASGLFRRVGITLHLAQLYTEFLPVEEMFNLAAAILRLFDRYGGEKRE